MSSTLANAARPVREPMIRLPGRVATFRFGVATTAPRSSLWLGANYLLQVNSGAMRDDYRRFYYRDIQTLQLRRTHRGLFYNLLLALLVIVFGVAAAFTRSPGVRVGNGLVGAVFAALLVVNVSRGPTVSCRLRTAIGLYPLPSLSRLQSARRAFASIRERVEATQGMLSPELITARLGPAREEPQRSQEPVNVGVSSPA